MENLAPLIPIKPVFIQSIGLGLPQERVRLGPEFLKTKRHFEDEPEVFFYRAGPQDTPFTLALAASRDAIQKASLEPSRIGAVIFAETLVKDYANWSMSAELCVGLGIPHVPFLDIYQGCNGLMAAIHYARNLLVSDPALENILCVTSLVLPPVLGRHEEMDTGGIFSDGASALVVSRTSGKYEILSLDMLYDAGLNNMIRMDTGGFRHMQTHTAYDPFNVERCKSEFMGDRSRQVLEQFSRLGHQSVQAALKKAEVSAADIRFLVAPNYCRFYLQPIVEMFPHLPPAQMSLDRGMTFSHMDSADIAITLNAMDAAIQPGERGLLHQDGAGFSFGTAVLRKLS